MLREAKKPEPEFVASRRASFSGRNLAMSGVSSVDSVDEDQATHPLSINHNYPSDLELFPFLNNAYHS